ncbi:molybdopterin-dependent oxidoreductase [Sphingorhabdus contaminans]|uniref:molybdopterin-dependent oxidoreductase n=1 Tax=Sphingorhabdus contaminans TaxID=1343899 RepID=UPI003D2E20DB
MITPLLLFAATSIPDISRVDDALMSGLPVIEADLTAHGISQKCSGPSLSDVLDRLGFPTGKELTGPALETGVIVRGRDGYAVLFSLGELDAALGAKSVIIATQCDGKPLADADGPYRLVLPGEERAARSVRQVIAIEAVHLASKSPHP